MNKRQKELAKNTAKLSLNLVKRVVKSNRYTLRAMRLAKRAVFPGWNQIYIHYHLYKYYPSIAEYWHQQQDYVEFKLQPLISIVMPTFNTPVEYLKECIESVQMQSYPNWELCIADDASTSKDVVVTIKRLMEEDERIKLIERAQNGHISAATNSAIEIATGEFIALLDHDDLLWPNALYETVKAINASPEVDLVYSDEDKVDEDGEDHSYPTLKPAWSPEFLESCNYITHFACIRANVLKDVGGFRVGYEGAQDWDLFIRITEKTNKIKHVPKILYSWRIHKNSTAQDTDSKPYVYEAQRRLLEDHIMRLGLTGRVTPGIITQHSAIQYGVINQPEVVIFIYGEPRDAQRAVRSIKNKTTYPNYRIQVLPAGKLADVVNKAAEQVQAQFLILLKTDIRIQTANWIEQLLGDAQRKGVGAVGPKIVSKGRFIRSAGYGIGMQGAYANLLDDMESDETHYLRGLYGQSRRNVAAVSGSCLLVSLEAFKKVRGISGGKSGYEDVDLCLKLLDCGYRNIYNPHAQVIDLSKQLPPNKALTREARKQFRSSWRKYIDNDPYLNPNFRRDNSALEIR